MGLIPAQHSQFGLIDTVEVSGIADRRLGWAVGEQGAYFEMVHAMTSRQRVWSSDVIETMITLASKTGIDADAVVARLNEQHFVPVLHHTVQDGRLRGVTAPPTFQIGPRDDRAAVLAADLLDLPIAGYDVLRQDIDDALAGIE